MFSARACGSRDLKPWHRDLYYCGVGTHVMYWLVPVQVQLVGTGTGTTSTCTVVLRV